MATVVKVEPPFPFRTTVEIGPTVNAAAVIILNKEEARMVVTACAALAMRGEGSSLNWLTDMAIELYEASA